MKSIFLNKSVCFIENNSQNITNDDLEKIKYGLEGIYLMLTKFVVFSLIMIYLNLFVHFLIFTFFFSIIRTAAFGIHATKSYICLISSSFLFILCPTLALNVEIDILFKYLSCIFLFISIVLYSPADTFKRPLINKKKRMIFKILSIIISIIYIFIIIFTNNNFLSNIVLFALAAETILILPITYKMFKLPYNNYKTYNYKPI
ncbi:MAG: accessory gene regulator B family protein [Bacilli bacterium]|nr:accessory gene regulator B family protein [Bacilli bacterium]MDD3305155.1 accessory gene regulator B family protein [Bacilli bacterium]MDD4053980.1 accessory gene regulator B family protein [Bacilli bacterium]MDD4411739.1 accessory gene regulator B family protein [Bacilli bacterium]